jgi:hypothetical protein
MRRDSIERAVKGAKVSRRWLLRNTASLTAGAVAVGSMSFAAAEAPAGVTSTTSEASPAETPVAPDHDPMTGEIFDRDRHHHWDTV